MPLSAVIFNNFYEGNKITRSIVYSQESWTKHHRMKQKTEIKINRKNPCKEKRKVLWQSVCFVCIYAVFALICRKMAFRENTEIWTNEWRWMKVNEGSCLFLKSDISFDFWKLLHFAVSASIFSRFVTRFMNFAYVRDGAWSPQITTNN